MVPPIVFTFSVMLSLMRTFSHFLNYLCTPHNHPLSLLLYTLTNLMMLLLANHGAGSIRGARLELLDASHPIPDLHADHQDVDRLCIHGDLVIQADRASPGPAPPVQSSSSTPLGSSSTLDKASLGSAHYWLDLDSPCIAILLFH
jgi:hypothetical protein